MSFRDRPAPLSAGLQKRNQTIKMKGKCTHKIGFFIGEGNPSNKLCKMFKKDCSLNNNPLVLTETVERLYLKPSTLIR